MALVRMVCLHHKLTNNIVQNISDFQTLVNIKILRGGRGRGEWVSGGELSPSLSLTKSSNQPMCAQLFRNILKTLHLPSGKIQFWIQKLLHGKKSLYEWWRINTQGEWEVV
jgi:hypothetical protein